MAYAPDATDVANPLDVGIQALTAAAEFRTIKLYMRDVLLAAINLRATLASPTFTGTPAAPTAAVDTNTTQLATTAYVIGQGYLKSATAAATYAPLASPALTGNPTAPTQALGNNSTRIATTAFVTARTENGAAVYTPACSNLQNNSASGCSLQWARHGDLVFFAGNVYCTATAPGQVTVGIPSPVNSAFSNGAGSDIKGLVGVTNLGTGFGLLSCATNQMQIAWVSSGAGFTEVSVSGCYRIN